jgi:hypothetical protein
MLRKLRTDSYFTHMIHSTWKLGPLSISRSHSPRHVTGYRPDDQSIDLFDENIALLNTQQLQKDQQLQDDHEVTVVSAEAQQQWRERWEAGNGPGTPIWTKPSSKWNIRLQLGNAYNSHSIQLKLS